MNNQNKHPKDKLYALVGKLGKLSKWHVVECRKFTDRELEGFKPFAEVVEGKYGHSVKFTGLSSDKELVYIPLLKDENCPKRSLYTSELYLIKLARHSDNTILSRVTLTPVETVYTKDEWEKTLQEIRKEKDRLTSLGVKVTLFDTCIPY